MFLKQKEKLKNNNINRKALPAGRQGFTLIEMLAVLFIFSLMTVTFYQLFSAGTVLMLDAKKRIAATHVANEKLEIIRGLSYDEVEIGTIIPETEYITSGTYQFFVENDIVTYDDPVDGEGVADSKTPDYKRVKATVSWGDMGSNQKVSLFTDVSPFGVADDIPNTGTLSIRVIDVDGASIDGASVGVSGPSENGSYTTTNGFVVLSGKTAATESYLITASKSGYDGASTEPPYPTSIYYPTDVHASVVDGDTTEFVISIGLTSDLDIQFMDAYGNSLSDAIDFEMKGGRILGTNEDSSTKYNFDDESLTSDSGGAKSFTDLSPGNYTVVLDSSETDYRLWKVNNSSGNEPNEIILTQSEPLHSEGIKLLDENTPSYFVRVIDADTGIPIEGANVELTSASLPYDEDFDTELYGYSFLPLEGSTLTDGETYDVTVTATGYSTENTTVTISGLTEDTISLSI